MMSRIGRWTAFLLAALVAIGGWFALPILLDAPPDQALDIRSAAANTILFPLPWSVVSFFDVGRSFLLYGCLVSNGLLWGFALAWVATKIGILPSWEEYDYLEDLEDEEFEDYDSELEPVWETWLRRTWLPALILLFPVLGFVVDRECFGLYDYVRTGFQAPSDAFSSADTRRLSKMRFLRDLDLSSTNVDDDGLQNIRNLTGLRRIDLSATPVNGRRFDCLQGMNRLEELNLDDSSVGNRGMRYLAEVTSLHALRVGGTNVSDRGVQDIASLPQLETLSLRGTRITDEALDALSQSRSLRFLNLQDIDLTPERVDRFRRENPNCQVEFP